jgi:hypothetical protein
MTIKRKGPGFEKKQKELKTGPLPKKVRRGFDLTTLTDLIIEGKLTAPVGSEVIMARFRDGKTTLHTGYIHSFNEKTGNIEIWDETVNQYFAYCVNELSLPTVKVLHAKAKIPAIIVVEQTPETAVITEQLAVSNLDVSKVFRDGSQELAID